MAQQAEIPGGRVAWVDYAKGFCIVFVVMMHSTLGVGYAAGHEGFLHYVVEFARPFRMPDFFMISGLFLPLVIDRPWRTYLDRKVAHFAYFYILWMTIQFAVKAPALIADNSPAEIARLYLLSFIDPFGTLWFIYLLPIFFVVIRLTCGLPPLAVWLAGAALQTAQIDTGWMVPDAFATYFVYIYTGYVLAPRIFRLAEAAQRWPWLAGGCLLLWGLLEGMVVFGGYSKLPLVSLALALFGACAVIAAAALMAKSDLFRPLRYCGRHSIVIYLAFFLPMAATRILMLKSGLIAEVGIMSAVVTAAGVIGSLALFWAVRGTPLRFLFERPEAFWLSPKPRLALQPAE